MSTATATAGDLLSPLPDEIIIHILSLLPSTKLRARTSVLSRRYRHLWRSSPTLDFPLSDFPDPTDYTPAVNHCLHVTDSPTLRRFRAHACPLSSPSIADFDRWIHFAARRHVTELALSFLNFLPHRPDLPESIVLAAGRLFSLKLIRCKFPVVSIGFPLLKYLYLSAVTLTDELADGLVNGCPVLEKVYMCNCMGLTRLEVRNKRLKWVNLDRVTRKSVDEVVVRVEGMRVFDFEGNVRKLRMGSAPELRMAQVLSRYWLVFEEREEWAGLVTAVKNVEVLAVSCWFFEFLIDEDSGLLINDTPVFKNLKEMHWAGVNITGDYLLALALCLKQCPLLEKLCINLDYYEELSKAVAEQNNEDEEVAPMEAVAEQNNEEEVAPMELAQSSNIEDLPLECEQDENRLQDFEPNTVILSRLKVFSVTQFTDNKYGMQLVEFILGRATNLQLLSLSIMPEPEMEFDLLHKKLSAVYHASQHVQIEISKIEGNLAPQDYKLFVDMWSF